MNILYVSYLYGRKWTGPNYSVPNQILAQSKYDNVFWYNINNLYNKNDAPWGIKCNTISDYPSLRILDLPSPFSKPDLVIFEGFYYLNYCKLAKECKKRNIPYIIIPRSSLTKYGQESKTIKKGIANRLFFNKFAKNATAIHYLTKEEYYDSGENWNSKNIIIPNGAILKDMAKSEYSITGFKGIFIGRLDIYQKGLDLLIDACSLIRSNLIGASLTISIHGPDKNDAKKKINELIKKNDLEEILFLKDPIFDEDKEKQLLESDFFILTSRFEGHPMGLIEALSYGLPSLVTKGSNMANEIFNMNAGWSSDTSVEGIAESLKQLIAEKQEFIKKGKSAICLAKKYDWEEIAKLSHKEYIQLI